MSKEPTYFQERKDFLQRMVRDVPKGKWRAEMGHTKKIFNDWPHDFLAKVKPPFQNMYSVVYFIGKGGKKYLQTELNKFNFKPEEAKTSVKLEEKVGEDSLVKQTKSIRQLLNE